MITFIDLAGHERYLKTTVFGMTGHAPDFGMLMVCIVSNMYEKSQDESLKKLLKQCKKNCAIRKLILCSE